MPTVVKSLRGVIPLLFNSRSALHLEILVLRHQLNIVTRGSRRSADITEVPMGDCLCPAADWGHPTRVCRLFGGLQRMIGMSLLSVGGAASRRSQHREARKAGLKCDRVSADTRPTELRLVLTSNTALSETHAAPRPRAARLALRRARACLARPSSVAEPPAGA